MVEPNMEDVALAHSLEMAASKAVADLIQAITRTDLVDMCYAYKSRVKTAEKLIQKKQIKRVEQAKENYEILDITDVVGLRLVALFRRDLPGVIQRILQIICNQSVTPSPFKENSIVEFKFFNGNVRIDPLQDDIASVVRQFPLVAKIYQGVETSKEEYSSVHIVAHLTENAKTPSNGDVSVPIEIQIRTVFEDAWGEIDHKFGYVIRSGKDSGEAIHNPASVLEHLKVLKKFTDACAEYADVIYKEAIEDLCSVSRSGSVISVESDDDVINRFRELGVEEEMIQSYISSRGKKESLATGQDQDITYASLAEEFSELSEKSTHDLFFYYTKMNEAFCLLSSARGDEVFVARKIYEDMAGRYKDYPLVFHRLGQVLNQTALLHEAEKAYETAWQLMHTYENKKEVGCDALPLVDFEHLKAYLPRKLGYNYWQKSEETEQAQDKFRLLSRAVEVTEEMLTSQDMEVQRAGHNNLLYYRVELVKYCSDLVDLDLIRTKCQMHIEKLEALACGQHNDDLLELDTISKAYALLGENDKATSICKKIIDKALKNQTDTSEPALVLQIAREARELLATLESLVV